MSILIKPYTLAIYDDVLENGRYVEKRLAVIGSDSMTSQCRALEPNFVRNVNGQKKLSFKMYKYYKDSITGEEIENPFVDWLISERKVKLQYEGEWHDFIVKNITENSSNYLFTYQLEDALVQELSKNGFHIVLDPELENNIGTANELASRVLEETDWSVSDESEVFVQTISETLVYLTLDKDIEAYRLKDQRKNNRKVGVVEYDNLVTIPKDSTILAFYSSCKNKPHRFQFIYTGNKPIAKDPDRNIVNEDCQYYIDYNTKGSYTKKIDSYDLILPTGFNTTTAREDGVTVTISTKYRGKRYGFSQQSKYIPVLERYVNLYENSSGTEYYGYEHSEYKSPAFSQNLISNAAFEEASGWTGTHTDTSSTKKKATVESVYGYFDTSRHVFVNSVDDLLSGTFNLNKNYKAYLKITFPDKDSRVVNSGPEDNRTIIGSLDVGDEYALWYKCLNANGTEGNVLDITLGEYKYDAASDGYLLNTSNANFGAFGTKDGYNLTSTTQGVTKNYRIAKVTSSIYSPESFKKDSRVRVSLSPPQNLTSETTYYLEGVELFRASYANKKIIPLEEQGNNVQNRAIEKTYYYFLPSAVKNIDNKEQLKPNSISKELTYTTYKPKYNEQAQKVRSVSVKESNYFNILQTIAQTFEAWLLLKVDRDEVSGCIESKQVCFKNYIGGDNYAGFRYGVNLKDIQRIFESKNIVTKLMVKQNANEHAKNGFCTIARAGANPTGESHIYDFSYFHNTGLLNSLDYIATVYAVDGASGPDLGTGHESDAYNLQGYFPRIKKINTDIEEQTELLLNTSKDLTKYKAKLEVANAGYDAAMSGIEETRESFEILTGAKIDQISTANISNIEIDSINVASEASKADKTGHINYNTTTWLSEITAFENISAKKLIIKVAANSTSNVDRTIYVKAYPKITVGQGDGSYTLVREYTIKCTILPGATEGEGNVDITVVDIERNDVQRLIKEFAVFNGQKQNHENDKNTAQSNVSATQAIYNTIKDTIDKYSDWKKELNKLFFARYSRYIQEGTWISEEYVDDEKYYADALSVMYNSCYPQVSYQINVLELSKLPGYEFFTFNLGDKTYAEDPDFFGTNKKEEVIIAEISEVLDDPSKNTIKVQNFKNQFQDLFQKITATVQQAQYSTGSYEKAVALVEANAERKNAFLTEAMDVASAKLTAAGQQSVEWGNDGITVKSVNSPCDAIRMVGGAILLSKQDKNGEQKWVTGVTSDGVSASVISAGILNVGEIQLMDYNNPVFRWDSFGISAYDATWYDNGTGTTVSGVDTKKFVRFDKHGIYGINGSAGVDGANWKPNDQRDIDDKATFALTWEGFKVTNERNIEFRIGDNAKTSSGNTNLLDVRVKNASDPIFAIKEDGSLIWGSGDAGSSPTQVLYSTTRNTPDLKPEDGKSWKEYPPEPSAEDVSEWHRIISPTDKYASYTYNGGINWSDPIVIRGDDGETGKGIGEVIEYYALSDDSENAPEEWTPNKILQPTQELPYLWNYEVTKYDDNDNTIAYQSDPIVIAYYTEDGDDGRGIVSIQNYYLINSGSTPGKPITTEDYSAVPEDGPRSGCWYTTAPKTTIIDEYLWNCEIITYSKEPTTVTTDPAVIGTHGASPYTISLDEDFISVQAANDGTVATGAFPSTTIAPAVFYGNSPISIKDSTDDLDLTAEPSGLKGDWNAEGTGYTVTAFDGTVDRGTVKFILKKDGEDKAYAIFEAVKQKSGTDGTPGEYVYAVSNYNEIKAGSFPDKIQISILKRTSGIADPSYVLGTVYYKVSLDGKSFSSKYSQPANGVLSIGSSHYASATSTIRIDIFSDSSCQKIIDKVTITVLKDGEDGEAVYILYHDAADSTPDLPQEKDYNHDNYKNYTTTGWYQGQKNTSVYMSQKRCKVSEQPTTNWEGVTRISGVLSNYNDLWNALDEKSKENNAYGGIYTIEDGSDKYIGVKADFIKTGALSVGDHPDFNSNGTVKNLNGNVLYADIENQKVLLAGWEVSSTTLKTGTIGASGSFGVYPLGISSGLSSNFMGTLPSGDAWIMTAGQYFGVTKKGHMFVGSGKIGGWTISSNLLASSSDQKFGLYSGSGTSYSINSILSNTTSPVRFFAKNTFSAEFSKSSTQIQDTITYMAPSGLAISNYKVVKELGSISDTVLSEKKYMFYRCFQIVNKTSSQITAKLIQPNTLVGNGEYDGISVKAERVGVVSGYEIYRLYGSVGLERNAKITESYTGYTALCYGDNFNTSYRILDSYVSGLNYCSHGDEKIYTAPVVYYDTTAKQYRIIINNANDFASDWSKFSVNGYFSVIFRTATRITLPAGSSSVNYEDIKNSNGKIIGIKFTFDRYTERITKDPKVNVSCTFSPIDSYNFAVLQDGSLKSSYAALGGMAFRPDSTRIGMNPNGYGSFLLSDEEYSFVAGHQVPDSNWSIANLEEKATISDARLKITNEGALISNKDADASEKREMSLRLYGSELWFEEHSRKGSTQQREPRFKINHFYNGTIGEDNNIQQLIHWMIGVTDNNGDYTQNYISFSRQHYLNPGIGHSARDFSTSTAALIGTWSAATCLGTGSDINLKNSLELPGEKYDLFFDKLSPTLFKYNYGTSGRKHFGFIAQDVENSLDKAGLTTMEFAGICNKINLFNDQNYYYTLRYEEFIALNTWQIQKLKPRVSTLEQTILDYETRISTLEQEIENLKKS